MKLSDFVSKLLLEIKTGVDKANSQTPQDDDCQLFGYPETIGVSLFLDDDGCICGKVDNEGEHRQHCHVEIPFPGVFDKPKSKNTP